MTRTQKEALKEFDKRQAEAVYIPKRGFVSEKEIRGDAKLAARVCQYLRQPRWASLACVPVKKQGKEHKHDTQ